MSRNVIVTNNWYSRCQRFVLACVPLVQYDWGGAFLVWPRSVHLVFGRVLLQLSLLIVAAEVRGDCAIDWLVTCYGCMVGTGIGIFLISLLYKRDYWHPSTVEYKSAWQTAHGTRLIPWWRCACCWPAWLDPIRFWFGIDYGWYTLMLGRLLWWRDSMWFCSVLMVWHDGGCVFAADCKYAERRRDDAERVAQACGECVRRVFDDCSR